MDYIYPDLPPYDNNNVILTSGGFDPIHGGHIAYLRNSAKVGRVWVILNSDKWLQKKKGREFLPIEQRKVILGAIKDIDHIIEAKDDNGSVVKTLQDIYDHKYPFKFSFSKGGDRIRTNTPEVSFCVQADYDLLWNMDAGETQSSSKFLSRWRSEEYQDKPNWDGFYEVIRSFPNVKVKILEFGRDKTLSLQRHFLRHEWWFILEGYTEVYTGQYKDHGERRILQKYGQINIPVKTWHQLKNIGNKTLKILEIQYGEDCSESDIERAETSIF